MKYLKKIGYLLFLVFSVIASIISTMLLFVFLENIFFTPKDFLLITFNAPMKFLSPFMIVGVGFFVFLFIQSKRKIIKNEFYEKFNNWLKKFKYLLVFLFIFSMYLQVTSVSAITQNEIIHHTFYNPLGTVYSYEDIRLVDTGVYWVEVNIPFIQQHKGDFYYIIKMKDGTRINLMDIGSENSNDSYYQIENIDKIIMPKKVLKSSSLDYIESVNLGEEYVDRFKRIIENK